MRGLKFRKVAVGGTFDTLHTGHTALIFTALNYGRKVVSSLRTVISLRELSIKFTISQRQVEYSRARGERVYSTSIDQAAIRLAYQEDSAILSDLLSNAKVRRVASR